MRKLEDKQAHADDANQCENCGVKLQGEFCHDCGQARQSSFRFFGNILMDLLDNLISYDSRVYRTLVPLISKPGYVCNAYLSGRRVRFLPPFRLYLFASILFFLLAPLETGLLIDSTAEIPGAINVVNKDEFKKTPPPADEIEVGISFLNEQQNASLEKKLRNILVNDNTNRLINATINHLPTMMFLLLPLFALVLKVLYLFSNRYYMEHVVVVLYSQSYLFFMLLIVLGINNVSEQLPRAYPSLTLVTTAGELLSKLLLYWISVHLFLVQKRVYQQSFALTLVKFCSTALCYFILLAIVLGFAILWGLVSV